MQKRKHKSRKIQTPVAHPPLIYRLSALESVVGLKRTAIFKRIKAGEFPKPVELSPRARGWLVAEVDEWLRSRAQQRDAARK